MVDNSIFATDNDVGDLNCINTEDLLDISSQSLLEDFVEFSVSDGPTSTPEHWNKFPNMDVVETKYGLDMHIDPGENQNWLFNHKMGKVFIKLNSVMSVTVSYKPFDNSNLYLRAMIVYTSPDDMHLNVQRCANHKASNKSSNENQDVPPEHILKCYHPNAKYVGNENSQLFGERLSIVVDLGRPAVQDVQENGTVNEVLMWEFLCQNSCATGMNRKSTAVIFTLENEHHDIVGKTVMPFKVCSCPKRDMQREDTSQRSRKREREKAVPSGKRPSKMPCLTEVKIEPPTPSPTKNFERPFIDNSRNAHTVTLTMPNKDCMKHVLRCAFNEVIGEMNRDKDHPSENYLVYADRIQGLLHSL